MNHIGHLLKREGDTLRLKVLIVCGVVILAGSVCLLAAFSQSPKEPEKLVMPHRVQVKVDAIVLNAKAIEGHMNRELRKLTNVEIETKTPDWLIYVMINDTQNKSGRHTGYMMGISIVRRWDLSLYLNEITPPALKSYLSVVDIFETMSLGLSGNKDEVYQQLTDMILSFDAQFLEPERQAFKELKR